MKKMLCPKCGTELSIGAKFCMECGEKIRDDMYDERREEQDNSSLEDEEVAVSDEVEKEDNNVNETKTNNKSKFEPKIDAPVIKKPKKKISKKNIIIGSVAVVILLLFIVIMSRPKITYITAKYLGDTVEGTVIDTDNKGIIVTGYTEEHEPVEISGWKVVESATLKADAKSEVMIDYKGILCNLTVKCSTSAIEEIYAEYVGDPKEGKVLDANNEDIHVYAKHKDGSESQINYSWTVTEPKTLAADGKETVEIMYENFKTELEVICSTRTLVGITAEYDGETKEGTVISTSNVGITVYAEYKNGDKEQVSGWVITDSVELVAGKTSEVEIKYKGQTCVLKVECSTMSEKQYKEACKKISYDSLARNPDDHTGKRVKFKGRIVQVLEDDGMAALRVNVTNNGYGYYDDTVYVWYFYKDGEGKFLEDDIITFYGTYLGLYTYESVMGAEITIPEVLASYIDLH